MRSSDGGLSPQVHSGPAPWLQRPAEKAGVPFSAPHPGRHRDLSGCSEQEKRLYVAGSNQGESTARGREVARTQIVVKAEEFAGTEDSLSLRSTWGRENNK